MMADQTLHILCRLCGKTDNFKVDIFGAEGAARDLKRKIHTCLPFEVSQDGILPQSLCYRCLHNLETYYDFYEACTTANITLHRLANVPLISKKSINENRICTGRSAQSQTDISDGLITNEFLSDQVYSPSNLNNILRHVLTRGPRDTQNKITENSQWRNEVQNRKREREIDVPHQGASPHKIAKVEDFIKSRNDFYQTFNHDEYDSEDNDNESDAEMINLEPRIEIYEGRNSPTSTHLNDSVPDLYNKVSRNYSLTYNCEFCNLTLPTKWERWLHISSTHATTHPNIICSHGQCRKVFISEAFRRDHEAHHELQGQYPNSCEICAKLWNTRTEFYKHLMGVHPLAAPLTCGQCLKILPSVEDLQLHVNEQHRKLVGDGFFCSICARIYTSKAKMLKHQKVHDEAIVQLHPPVALDTSKRLEWQEDSKLNISLPIVQFDVANRGDWSKCTDCDDLTFDSFAEFSTHARLTHSVFHCDLCTKSYGRNSHLWKHVNKQHKGHTLITCPMCFTTSASRYHLQQHINKHHGRSEDMITHFLNLDPTHGVVTEPPHQNNDSDSDSTPCPEPSTSISVSKHDINSEIETTEIYKTVLLSQRNITLKSSLALSGPYKCEKCEKTFHKKYYLKQHNRTCRPKSQNELLTRCKACERVFKDRESLTKHLNNYHSSYKCHICPGVEYASKLEIINHNRFAHPNHPDLICTNKSCSGGILRSPLDLYQHHQKHLLSPASEELQICQFCGDTLSSKVKRKMHILSLHRKILTLSCGVCLKLHGSQHDLMKHVETEHRKDISTKNFCRVCGKVYGSKWKVYDHVVKSHGTEFTVCKTCLSVFDTELQLSDHVKLAHITKGNKTTSRRKSNINAKRRNSGQNSNIEIDQNFNSNHSLDHLTEQNVETKFELTAKVEQSDNYYSSDVEEPLCDTEGEDMLAALNKTSQASKGTEHYKVLKGSSDQNSGSKTTPNNTTQNSKRKVYENDGPSQCASCYKVWPAKKHLWQHYIRRHKRMAATTCGICLQVCPNYETLRIHLNKFHTNLLHGCGFGSNFICKICGRYHNASSKLSLHMMIHESITEKKPTPVNTTIADFDHFMATIPIKTEHNNEESDDDDQINETKDDENSSQTIHINSLNYGKQALQLPDLLENKPGRSTDFVSKIHETLDTGLKSETEIAEWESDSESVEDETIEYDAHTADLGNIESANNENEVDEDEDEDDEEENDIYVQEVNECDINAVVKIEYDSAEDDVQNDIDAPPIVTPLEVEQLVQVKSENQTNFVMNNSNNDSLNGSDDEDDLLHVESEIEKQMLANMLGENKTVDTSALGNIFF